MSVKHKKLRQVFAGEKFPAGEGKPQRKRKRGLMGKANSGWYRMPNGYQVFDDGKFCGYAGSPFSFPHRIYKGRHQYQMWRVYW